jgi:hypothetical protein
VLRGYTRLSGRRRLGVALLAVGLVCALALLLLSGASGGALLLLAVVLIGTVLFLTTAGGR